MELIESDKILRNFEYYMSRSEDGGTLLDRLGTAGILVEAQRKEDYLPRSYLRHLQNFDDARLWRDTSTSGKASSCYALIEKEFDLVYAFEVELRDVLRANLILDDCKIELEFP